MDEEKYITVLLERCPRCGESHTVDFSRFYQPVFFFQEELVTFTHWGICDHIFEPVLLRIEEHGHGEL